MGANRRLRVIVLVVFGLGGLSVGEIRIINLVILGEELNWLEDRVDIFF